MDKYPVTKFCPYCGGVVIHTTNDYIYGRKYSKNGNCNCYVCTICKASVGTHPDGVTPLGRLADRELKDLKMQAHALFDPIWKSRKKKRHEAYRDLARQLDIPVRECHFGWFGKEMLLRAITILQKTEELQWQNLI